MLGSCRTRHGAQLRKVTTTIHKGRPCTPCILCKQGNHSKYSHPKSWKDHTLLQKLLDHEPTHKIEADSCICRLCRDDITRLLNSEGYIPRWRKKNASENPACCYIPGCKNPGYKTTKLVDERRICEIFSIPFPGLNQETPNSISLCTQHYSQLNRYLKPEHYVKQCRTCNKSLSDPSKARRCPNPELIQNYLAMNIAFPDQITAHDRVCFACYKSHLVFLKHLQGEIESTDNDLSLLLDTIRESISTESCSSENVLHYASKICALEVGECILQQKAVLLPDIYDSFLLHVDTLCSDTNTEMTDDISTIAPASWLCSQLSSTLDHHLAFKCSVKRYGTVLYRYGGDLLHALNVSLGNARITNQKMQQSKTDSGISVTETCSYLNQKIHNCINKFVTSAAKNGYNIEDIDLEQFTQQVDPDLWNAICTLTQPLSQKHKTKISHRRNIRRLYCLCVILFTTNARCSFPLHTLITDAIESFGGTSRLIKLLNRLGVCASVDTHDRHVQSRVQRIKQDDCMAEFSTDTLSIVTVDNLDFKHNYGRVVSGKHELSWHGTTIQIVQPQPTIKIPATTSVDTTTYQSVCDENTIDRHPPEPAPAPELQGRTNRKHPRLISPATSFSPSRCPPLPKKQCRARTGKESCSLQSSDNSQDDNENPFGIMNDLSDDRDWNSKTLKLSDYQITDTESKSQNELQDLCKYYMLQKIACTERQLANLQLYYTLIKNVCNTEVSNIGYYKVLDQKCDSKETLLNVISELYEDFIYSQKKKWLMVEGDAETYVRLQSIKTEYGNDLSWMIVMPGDWHMLKNFQEVLIKAYFDAGLCDLAASCGYPTQSIGSKFKRTHHFLLEAWESIYRFFVSSYLSSLQEASNYLSKLQGWLENFPTSSEQLQTTRNIKQIVADIKETFPDFETGFNEFIDEQCSKSNTWLFWKRFVFHDCFAYVSLYIAIRNGVWDLRMAAIKSMAPLFTAFDRLTYQKLISLHIADTYRMPDEALAALQSGAFAVSVLGRDGHSVGLDEVHEMCINKQCKEYITKPNPEYINRIATFLPVRAKAMRNFERQIFPEKEPSKNHSIFSPFTANPTTKKTETNIKSISNKLNTSVLNKNEHVKKLQHLFDNKSVSSEQEYDLLNFRLIGKEEFENRVTYRILQTPSAKPPKRRKRLLTFTERKTRPKKVSDVEKERKLQVECWKKKIAYASTTGRPLQNMFEQVIELPRAIATSEGLLNKGTKANATKVFEKRYEHATPQIFTHLLPSGWVPSAVIMEGMFLINIKPWSAHKTFAQYAEFLMKQHILPWFRNGTSEVHLLFDDPDSQTLSPKYFERLSRDKMNLISALHYCCDELTGDMLIPPKWREDVLNCRKCKQALVHYLANQLLQTSKHRLLPGQRFVTAGGVSRGVPEQGNLHGI